MLPVLSLIILVANTIYTMNNTPEDVRKQIIQLAVLPIRFRYNDLCVSLKTYRSLCLVNTKFNALLQKLTCAVSSVSQRETLQNPSHITIKERLQIFIKESRRTYYDLDNYHVAEGWPYLYKLVFAYSIKDNTTDENDIQDKENILSKTEHFLEHHFGNVEIETPQTKVTPLGEALISCDSTMVELLLKYGANPDCVARIAGEPVNATQFITVELSRCYIERLRQRLMTNLSLFDPNTSRPKNRDLLSSVA